MPRRCLSPTPCRRRRRCLRPTPCRPFLHYILRVLSQARGPKRKAPPNTAATALTQRCSARMAPLWPRRRRRTPAFAASGGRRVPAVGLCVAAGPPGGRPTSYRALGAWWHASQGWWKSLLERSAAESVVSAATTSTSDGTKPKLQACDIDCTPRLAQCGHGRSSSSAHGLRALGVYGTA